MVRCSYACYLPQEKTSVCNHVISKFIGNLTGRGMFVLLFVPPDVHVDGKQWGTWKWQDLSDLLTRLLIYRYYMPCMNLPEPVTQWKVGDTQWYSCRNTTMIYDIQPGVIITCAVSIIFTATYKPELRGLMFDICCSYYSSFVHSWPFAFTFMAV